MLAEKAPSQLVLVGHHRDSDASPLLFWDAAVIERAHPDLLHPREFHALRFEEPPDGFDPALDEAVVVVARARGVAEAPEPHDQGWPVLELLDHAEVSNLRAVRQLRLSEGEVDVVRVHNLLLVTVRPGTRQAAVPALGPGHRGICA